MLVLVVAHLVCALVVPLLPARTGRAVWVIAAVPPLAAFWWALAWARRVLDGRRLTESVPWAPELGLRLDFRLDVLGLLLVLVVSGIGVLVIAYSAAYGASYTAADRGREAGLLVGFAGLMLGLVTADNLFLLYAFWELTTVASFLLIAGRRPSTERRRAAEQSLLTTIAGGLAMLLGLVMLGGAAGTYRLSELLADPPHGGAVVTAALVLILVGAFTKSAQYPFHSWLPAAMVAPTPVSAYLHAAAMVKAGVYLVARLAPGFADEPVWRPLVLGVGLASMVLGAWHALRENDLKRVLAFATVSELGMLIALFGAGTRTAVLGGAVMLLAHALFKSCMFMVTGLIDHAAGTRDLRRLSGLGRRMPLVCAVGVLAAASTAGLPPLIGYVGEDAGFDGYLNDALPGGAWALAAFFTGSVLTVGLAARWVWGAFARKTGAPGDTPLGAVSPGLVWPAAVPSALGLVLGVWTPLTDALTAPWGDEFPADGHKPYHVSLWHGVSFTLFLALFTFVLGAGLHVARDRVIAAQRRLPRVPDGQYAYRRTVRAVVAAAVHVTRVTQVGSLPTYLAAVLGTVVVLSAGALCIGASPVGHVPLWQSVAEVPPALVVLATAVAVTVVHQRLAAVLLTGAVGYGVAVLFVVRGAPDLALTQFLVETLTLVVTALVLRRLPARFTPERQPAAGRWVRGVIAVAIGAVVAALALVATHARDPAARRPDYLARVGETGGENVVNAIIVDFRAFDTLGEISVLMITTVGVLSLVRVWGGAEAEPGAREPVAGPAHPPPPVRDAAAVPERSPATRWDAPKERWLPGAGERPDTERSVLMEVVTRALFTSVVVLSLFLLFSGHYGPGGGFAGGLVAGQAFLLRYLVGGRADLGLAAPADPNRITGGGLAVAAVVALVPLVAGHPPLTSAVWHVTLPVLGEVHGSTSLFFDIGVYLLVVGVILKLLSAVSTVRDATAPPAAAEEGGTA
ncbi:Na+/H+ antiporter subunit A [Streptomyces sp. RFCAC02]|uniref:Na+/H+ antiporter subunit A n=1 Tax=Streptomyces sp. RFCAC02 TaxID=2499143 RepID=UPI00101F8F47|nr:Na+/H+ antiporter subunit A [Streptomyces sp. RFCAC02]